VSRYQKGKTNLDFTEAGDSEWQWHQLRHMQVCTSLQTDNHTSTPPLSFLQAGCPSCRPTNSDKALKGLLPFATENYEKLRAKPKAACEPRCLSQAATSSSLGLCADMTSCMNRKYVSRHCAARGGPNHGHIGNSPQNW